MIASASPRCTILNASPIEFVPVAHAVTVAPFGPFAPKSIDTYQLPYQELTLVRKINSRIYWAFYPLIVYVQFQMFPYHNYKQLVHDSICSIFIDI